ncbi:MAG: hypothetical protein J7493_11620, partial [Porphyrobacter sp.]|nr:hypothetical protein [Porphyrobacter sp.]
HSRASAEQERHWQKQSSTKQARWQAHDGHPLSRDCESRFSYLDKGLQRIGRFAKLPSITLKVITIGKPPGL